MELRKMKKGENNKSKSQEKNYIDIPADIFVMVINYLSNTTKLTVEHYKQFKYHKSLSIKLEIQIENTLKIFKKKIKSLQDSYKEATEKYQLYLEKYIE